MSLIKYSPFRARGLDRIFDDFYSGSSYEPFSSMKNSFPAVNVKEHDDYFEVALAAPGYSKDDFNVTLDKDHLVISVEKEETTESGENDKFTRKEFSYQSFTKRFHLSKDVDHDKISARYEDGILTITLNKMDPKKETKSIKVG